MVKTTTFRDDTLANPQDILMTPTPRLRTAIAFAYTALAAGVFAVNIPGRATVAAAAASSQKIAVPSYFYPGEAWDTVIASGSATGIAVVNPASGPGDSIDSNYLGVVTRAKAAGQRVVGYVDTNYTARPIADVQADVAKYYTMYGVDGIFLDRVTNTCDKANYYRAINTDVDNRPGGRVLVLNPGTNVPECFSDAADVIINFEGTHAMYQSWSPDSWVAARPASMFWHVVYDSPLSSQSAVIATSRTRNAGYLYVTDDWIPNPYDNLPSGAGWAQLVSSVTGTPTASSTTVATTSPPVNPSTTATAPTTAGTPTSAAAPTTTVVSATTAAPTTTTRPATTAAPAPASGIVPLTPTRILDTRSSLGGRPGAVGPGREITFPVLGVGGVPSTGVTAVIVNITSTDATTPSYVTVWPSTDARPNTSNLNPMSDRPDHALVFTKLGTDGAIKLYNAFGNVHLIVDIAGYVATG